MAGARFQTRTRSLAMKGHIKNMPKIKRPGLQILSVRNLGSWDIIVWYLGF